GAAHARYTNVIGPGTTKGGRLVDTRPLPSPAARARRPRLLAAGAARSGRRLHRLPRELSQLLLARRQLLPLRVALGQLFVQLLQLRRLGAVLHGLPFDARADLLLVAVELVVLRQHLSQLLQRGLRVLGVAALEVREHHLPQDGLRLIARQLG